MKEEILKPELKLENNSLDKNYQDFFRKSSQLLDNIEAKDEITKEEIESMNSFFENYLRNYFEEEEKLQEKMNYPYFEEHKRTHQILYNRINNLITNLKEETNINKVYNAYNEIRSLFKTHIYYIDHRFEKQIAN